MEIKVRKPFFLNFKKVPTPLKIFCDNISGSLRDFQLLPSLEEFSYLLGLPVLDQIPYTGKEEDPKWEDIAASLHLPKAEIEKVLISKKEYSGLPLDFLNEKAEIFAKASSMDALEGVLSLLIYGQVLFHHYDKIVDVAAIKIFLSKSPVPTLLGDLLHSIHFRASKRKGWVLGCAPLLHKCSSWEAANNATKKADTLKLERSKNQQEYEDCEANIKSWKQEIEQLKGKIKDAQSRQVEIQKTNQDELTEVAQSGIRHFESAQKPTDSYEAKKRDHFIKAWSKVKKFGAKDIGRRNYIPLDPYFQWIYDRVVEFGMPYPSDTPIVPRIAPPTILVVFEPYVPSPNEDLVATVNQLKREMGDFERRLREAKTEKEVLIANAKEREALLDYFSRKWKIEDFISPDQINSWEQEISRLVQEREEMIKTHKEEVRILKSKRRQEDRSPGI
ncbi:uncharacterized protein LOC131625401 [Vicia villosa]|uniref:uncharacterized protein LOC131625401 n=1 Tax=Vicia villosa TaxID=3911 RepID=UPI00273B033C|nr:uncharacterized protein LOC131625401 [Vicia villosa]